MIREVYSESLIIQTQTRQYDCWLQPLWQRWLAREEDFVSLLFCSHTGCCCQSQSRGTAQCNEQDYQGRLAGIVWYQRKSSQ